MPIYQITLNNNDKIFDEINLPDKPIISSKATDISIEVKNIILPLNAVGFRISFDTKHKGSKGTLYYKMNSPGGYNYAHMDLRSGYINWEKFYAKKRVWNSWSKLAYRSNLIAPPRKQHGYGMRGAKFMRVEIEYIDGADWSIIFGNI